MSGLNYALVPARNVLRRDEGGRVAGAYGRTIRVFLIDAIPEGMRLTDTSGWTGSCPDFAPGDYARARARLELARCGVYLLVGTDEDPSGVANRVDVGESDDVLSRIDGHQKDKAFWSRGTKTDGSREKMARTAHLQRTRRPSSMRH